jgi:hypothetical protein
LAAALHLIPRVEKIISSRPGFEGFDLRTMGKRLDELEIPLDLVHALRALGNKSYTTEAERSVRDL